MVEIYGEYRHHTDDPCFILGQLTHTPAKTPVDDLIHVSISPGVKD